MTPASGGETPSTSTAFSRGRPLHNHPLWAFWRWPSAGGWRRSISTRSWRPGMCLPTAQGLRGEPWRSCAEIGVGRSPRSWALLRHGPRQALDRVEAALRRHGLRQAVRTDLWTLLQELRQGCDRRVRRAVVCDSEGMISATTASIFFNFRPTGPGRSPRLCGPDFTVPAGVSLTYCAPPGGGEYDASMPTCGVAFPGIWWQGLASTSADG